MARIDGSTGVATPSGRTGSGSNTAAVNAAQTNLTAAQQRVSTTRDGISTLQSAYDSINSQYETANTAYTTAQTSYQQLNSQVEALNSKVTTAQQGVDTAKTASDAAQTKLDAAKTKLDTANQQKETAQTELDAAQQALDAAQSKADTSQEALDAAQEKVDAAKEKFDAAQEKVDGAQQKVDTAQQRVDTAQQAVDTAQQRVDTAQQALDTAQQRVDTAQQAVDTAQQRLDTAQTAVDAAQQRTDTAQTALDNAQTTLDAANDRVDGARSALDSATTELSSATEAFEAAQSALETATADVTAKQGELDSATAAVGKAQTRATNAQAAVSSAQGAVNSAQSALSSAEARLRANPNDASAKAAVSNARARLNSARGKLAAAQNEQKAAQAALQQAQDAERRAKQALEQAKERKRKAEDELKAATERKQKAEDAKRKAEDELKAAEQAQKEAQDALKAAQEELKAAQEELKAAQDELKAAQDELKAAQDELKTAQEELKAAQDELKEAQEELKTAQEELKAAQDELKAAQDELKAAQDELEAAKTEQEDAQKELEAKQKELDDATKALEEKQKAVDEAQSKLDDAVEAADLAQTDVDDAQKALDDAKQDLEDAQKELDDAKKEQDELKAKADEAKAEMESKKQEADRLKAEADDKKQDLADAKARLTQLQSEVDAAQAALDQAKNAKGPEAEAPKIEGDTNHDGILSDAERKALADAKNLDGALTPEEAAALQKQQDELRAAEDAARERYNDVNGAVTNSSDAQSQAAMNKSLQDQANQEIIDERRRYYEQNPYYVDANGTVFVASVDAHGNLQLQRNSSQPAKGNDPATQTERTATIETNRNRTDVEKIVTGAGTTAAPKRTQTTTVKTDPKGEQTSAQIKLEEEAKANDGSSVHRTSQEDYDARNVKTQSLQEETTTSPAGDTSTQRVTTSYHEDGTSPSRVLNEQEQKGADGSESSHVVDTNYARDGVSPTRQVVTDDSKDKDGNQSGTRAETEYNGAGEPDNTYIQRTGDREDGVPATEYVTWGANGDVTQRIEGGTEATRDQFRDYLTNGTQPPKHDIPAEPEPLDFNEWKSQQEADGTRVGGYAAMNLYRQYTDEFNDTTHKDWEAERDRLQAINDQSDLQRVDPDRIINGEDPIKWTRQDDDRFTSESLGGRPLIEPIKPSTDTPSVFEVPAQLQARANAQAIDSSPYAKDPAKLAQLSQEQADYEERLAKATTDDARERIMREYFANHDYWIDHGTGPDAQPTLMAAAWSNGAPQSELFGGARLADPHATAARTGIEGTDDMGQPATIDVVKNMFVDGSRDDVIHTTYDGPAGASREVVDGTHTNAAGVVTEHDRNAQSMVSRTAEGKSPLAVTEITRERFNETTGKPQGEQYNAVATSDATMTSLEERRDQYDANGTIYDTTIDSTNMSRNYDADITDDFLKANQDIIDLARSDDFKVDRDGQEVTVPPAGSYLITSHTDIDYDGEGNATHQTVDESSTMVQDAGDDNHNGVRVVETDTHREAGAVGGGATIFDEQGNLVVPEDVTTSIKSTEFDPDAGTAGGNHGTGHQLREITSITMHRTMNPDGSSSDEWATPLTTQTLREGFDDDWQFDEKYLKTEPNGQVVVNDKGEPQFVKIGDEIRDANGNVVRAGADRFEDGEIPPWFDGEDFEIHHEDLDFADKFEEFMEGWGGKIVGVAAIVAGIGAAAFTGGASLALTAVGVGLASTTFAYTALNYSQGEASGWDLAIAGAGVALAALPAITSVKQLANASRVASEARAAGLAENVVDDLAKQALRGSAGFGHTAETALKGAETIEHGMDGLDVYDAGRAAMQGDFWGAGMMLFAVGAGSAVSRVRAGSVPGGIPDVETGPHGGTPDIPDLPDTPRLGGPDGTPHTPDVPHVPDTPHVDTPHVDTPATSQGAPTVRTNPIDAPGSSTTRPITGSSTGDQPRVAAAHGNGVEGSGPGVGATSTGAAGAGQLQLPDATRPTSPTPADFSAHVDNPRADGVAAGDAWGGQERFDAHVDKHLGDYNPARYEAAGLELPTTRDGRPITDAATYHERALDYREMAVTGRLEDGVTSYPRANGGTMLVNSRTNEIAFINADGTVGSLFPLYNVKSRADGSYARNGNPENRLNSYVTKELQSDNLVYAVRRANETGDAAGMQQALDSLQQLNQNRYDAVVRELDSEQTHPNETLSPAAAGAPIPEWGRRTTRNNVGRLEAPIPREYETRGGLAMRNQQAPASRALLGSFDPNNQFAPIARGADQNGRVVVDRPLAWKEPSIEGVIELNPDLVARFGGADVIRANPGLLDGHTINVRRSNGAIEGGWRIDGLGADGTVRAGMFETRSMDVGELIVRRQQADPSFDGRAALASVIDSDPALLMNRPLRVRRSDSSIERGNVAHNIDDGWSATRFGRAADGSLTVDLAKNYRFEDLTGELAARAKQQGYKNGDVITVHRERIPLSEVLDYNRARLEGDHGQVPNIEVRYQEPNGPVIGTNRNLADGPATARADQAVVHTQAALDYLYSRYGYVPTGGDITLVIDANGAHNNASMQSRGNVLRIGTHDSNGGAFDPSVIMHELGHKMVDDLTLGHYGDNLQAGSIHEGIADVMAAGWTHDAIIGRVFNGDGSAIRDIRTGEMLIGSRDQWNAAAQSAEGAGAHRGSGVITGVASRLVDPVSTNARPDVATRTGGLQWGEVGDLYHDALATGGMRTQMDFDSFSDSLRIAAAQRYGIDSPQYRRVADSLDIAGLGARPAPGSYVSRITSRSTVEHGLQVVGYDQRGFAVVRNAAGQEFYQLPEQLLTGGGRSVRVDANGRVIPIEPRPSQPAAGYRAAGTEASASTGAVASTPGSAWATAGTNTGAGAASSPNLFGRLFGGLSILNGNATTQPAQQADRDERAREQREAELAAQARRLDLTR
ncbi:MAG: hypothetical protein KDC46_06980 [Thermoleophilia bacterium]|nr:hypothetical protein [Thermoleophilia bacterium]